MKSKVIYQEKHFSKGITIILGIVTLAVYTMMIIQMVRGPLGSKHAPTWVIALIGTILLLATLNFAFLKITLTDQKVKIFYGLFGTSRKWVDLKLCEKDEKNHFYGWGIRFGRYKHDWVWVYNVIGGPRVAFLRKEGKQKSLIISTKNPDEIVKLANEQIEKNN